MSDKTYGEQTKTWLEVVLMVAGMVLFVVLAKQPYRIVDWCKSAGFTKCTVLGAEYASALDAEQLAGELKVQVAAITAKSEAFEKALEKAIQSNQVSGLPEVKRELQAQAQAVSTAVGQIEAQAERNLRVISSVVDQVATDGNWAVVFGGFPEFAPANAELLKAKQAGIKDARVVLKNYDGKISYRSVALFTNRDAARQAVNTVNAFSSRKDAYLVEFDNWCKGKRDVVHEMYGEISECK